jgi:hypothetical protein
MTVVDRMTMMRLIAMDVYDNDETDLIIVLDVETMGANDETETTVTETQPVDRPSLILTFRLLTLPLSSNTP